MFTKILVPLDWSAPCASAVGVALTLAGEQRAKVVFLHVREPVVDLGISGFAPVSTTIAEASQREVDTLLEGAVARAKGSETEAAGISETGPITETILSVCAREACDLIVIGTHGRTGLARAFIGSVTEAVLRGATVPVLAVHVPDKA